jgi:hypothetical protein
MRHAKQCARLRSRVSEKKKKTTSALSLGLEQPPKRCGDVDASGPLQCGATAIFAARGGARSDVETSTIRTTSWWLNPFLVLAYFFSYLGRVNLDFRRAHHEYGVEILAAGLRLGRGHLLRRGARLVLPLKCEIPDARIFKRSRGVNPDTNEPNRSTGAVGVFEYLGYVSGT